MFLVAGCSGVDGDTLEVTATLAGRDIAGGSALDPIELRHEEITELQLDLANVGAEPVTVAHVRLEGRMLDFIFLSYDTGINETLQPGETRRVAFELDFFDLDGQAHGLLRSDLRLYGPDREPLGQVPFVIDGRGSPLATMAVFNIVLGVVAVASLGWNLLRLAQRQLPAHRFARGVRFVHSGAALGLAVSAAFSTLRIWPLTTLTWVVITALAALVGFAIGYASPGADDEVVVIDLNDPMHAVVSTPTPQAAHGLPPAAQPESGGVTVPAGPVVQVAPMIQTEGESYTATDAFRVTRPLPDAAEPPPSRILPE
ncbi:MAG: hypothetical protein AAF962_23980 [Actinomycetota bacterium]